MKNGMESFFGIIKEVEGLDKLVSSYQHADDSEKKAITQRLAPFVSNFSQQSTGLAIQVPTDEPYTIIDATKSIIGFEYGKRLFKKLPGLIEGIVDEAAPSVSYGIMLPKLENLAAQVGFGNFKDASYIPIKAAMEEASKGKLDADVAYKIAKNATKKHLKEVAKIDPNAAEDVNELSNIIAELWSKNRAAKEGKLFFTTIVYNQNLVPYAESNSHKINDYAASVADKALNSGFAKTYKGYETISEFGQTSLATIGKANALIEKSGFPAYVYVKEGQEMLVED